MKQTNQKSFWKGALCGALAMFLAAGIAFGGYAAYRNEKIKKERVLAPYTEKKLKEMQQLVNRIYLRADEVKEEELEEYVLKGYIAGLGDPYSSYFDKEETKKLMEMTSGEFSGLGLVVKQNQEDKVMTITDVYENGSGAEAGLQVGDIIYKVGEEDVTGQDLSDVVQKMKGKEGSKVSITVFRGENSEEFTAMATRKKVEIKTVSYEMKQDKIGYIQVEEFDNVTYSQFEAALHDLEQQGMEGLIVDLRDNPGGNLDTVCDMLDLILPEGKIVYTKDRDGKEKVFSSDAEHQLNLPLTVLTNEKSASASEIFAGAVQDYHVGKIVGKTTFGKGVVQRIFPMRDGTSLKLTVSEYFTPNGRNIHEKGIEPDVEVELQPEEVDETGQIKDTQLEKAIEVTKEQMKK